MGILPLILTYFLISEISAYSMTQVEGIVDRPVMQVNFDAEGNTYVVVMLIPDDINDYLYRLYKLNPSNEILLQLDLHHRVWDMLISSQGDAYFYTIDTIGVVRANSREFEIIDDTEWYSLFHLDKNNNLFYSSKDKGIMVIRPDSPATAIPIVNLENFSPQDLLPSLITSDKSGNIYIPVESRGDDQSIALAVITNEALQEERPYAIFINNFENTTRYSSYVTDIMMDEEETLWITLRDGYKTGVIERFVKGNWETILVDTHRPYNKMFRNKEKTYIAASVSDSSDTVTNMYFINSNDEFVEIPELNNLTAPAFRIHGIVDSEGQIYIYSIYEKLSPLLEGKIITIKPDEIKPIPIPLGSKGRYTQKAMLDPNNDLWIMNSANNNYNEIYHLAKGKVVPDLVDNPNGICYRADDININFITKTVYVSCDTGLFIVNNN